MTRLIPTLRRNPRTRRIVCDIARTGTALSAVMLVFSMVAVIGSGQVTAAAQNAGAVQVLVPAGSPTTGQPLLAGGSDTPFALTPPSGASCSGDSVSGGYRINTYMVPSSVNPATLTFNASGPVPAGTGANYRQPMFTSAGSTWVNKLTGIASSPGGGGLLVGLPTFSFGFIGDPGTTFLPAGTYNVGYACTLGVASVTQLDKYWNVQITVIADATDVPSRLTWVVGGAPPPTTTTTSVSPTTTTTMVSSTTTSTMVSSTTTTTMVSPTTTTTPRATTTTTTPRATTTTTTAPRTTTTTTTTALPTTTTTTTGVLQSTTTTTTIVAAAAPPITTVAPPFVSPPRLPATGSSPIPVVFWGILLLVFGRMAILFARPLEVVSA